MGCLKQAPSSLTTSLGEKLLAVANGAVSRPDAVVVGLSSVVTKASLEVLVVGPAVVAAVESGAPPGTAVVLLVVVELVLVELVVLVLVELVVVMFMVAVVLVMVLMLMGVLVTFRYSVVLTADRVVFPDVVLGNIVVVAARFGPAVANRSALQNSSSGRVAVCPF